MYVVAKIEEFRRDIVFVLPEGTHSLVYSFADVEKATEGLVISGFRMTPQAVILYFVMP